MASRQAPAEVTDRPALRRRPLTAPEPAATLEEIAVALNVTPERVRQIERKALNKLRRLLTARGYSGEDII